MHSWIHKITITWIYINEHIYISLFSQKSHLEGIRASMRAPSRRQQWVKGALQLLSKRHMQNRFAQVPERNSVSSSDSDLSAIYPWIRNNSEEASYWCVETETSFMLWVTASKSKSWEVISTVWLWKSCLELLRHTEHL